MEQSVQKLQFAYTDMLLKVRHEADMQASQQMHEVLASGESSNSEVLRRLRHKEMEAVTLAAERDQNQAQLEAKTLESERAQVQANSSSATPFALVAAGSTAA